MKKLLIASSCLLALSGCSQNNLLHDMKNARDQLAEVNQHEVDNTQKLKNIEFLDSAYAFESIINTNKQYLASEKIDFFSTVPLTIVETLQAIQDEYGIQFTIMDTNSEKYNYDKLSAISFSGSLEEFIAYLQKTYNYSINLESKNMLSVSYFKDHVYNLQQYFEDYKFSSSISIGGTDGTSSGLSGTSDVAVESDSWSQIEKFLTDQLQEGEKFTIFEDYSLVTVRARPNTFKSLDSFFGRIVAESKMQIGINYRVIAINEKRLNQLAAKMGLKQAGIYDVTTDMVDAISLSQLGGGVAASYKSLNMRLDAIVSELSQEVLHEGHFVGVPNRVMPLNSITNSKYIASIETTKNSEINEETTSVSVGDITTGFSLMVLPKILDDGRIQITSGFSRKQLVLMESAQGVMLPTVDENESTNTVILNSGDIKLVTLFKERANEVKEGVQLIGAGYEKEGEGKFIAVLIGASSYKSNDLMKKK